MNDLRDNGFYNFKNPFDYIYAYTTDETKTLEVIKEVYESSKYLMDPHTSVAYNAYQEYKKQTKDGHLTVIVSTASPFKFPQTVLKAFDFDEESDPFKAAYIVSKEFDLELPKVLNYGKSERKIVSKEECERKVEE